MCTTQLGIGIIMVGNEKASAPSIESLRSACEGSDNAPIGLWNWIAALKSQRRSSVLKNFLSKVIQLERQRASGTGRSITLKPYTNSDLLLSPLLPQMIVEHPNNYAARLLRANQYKLSGRLPAALIDYLKVLHQSQGDHRVQSVASLYAGVTCLNIAVSKREVTRYAVVR